MKVTLHIEPNTPPLSWEEFRAKSPPGSIAIDGYVYGPVQWDPLRKILNLNHHEGCDRLTTRCTAAQANILIRSGLMRALEGAGELHLWMNDCDEDVTATVWSFQNAHRVETTSNPILNRIINVEDLLDTTAGAYGFSPQMPAIMENNWVFEHYKIARLNGALARRDPVEFRSIIDAGCDRISRTLAGGGEKLELDVRYEVIDTGTGWSMVREIGFNARIGMYANGINAFVAAKALGNSRYTYSIGRRSIFIPFPVTEILSTLDEHEGDTVNHWGGGDTIGGSPRATGSRITPIEVKQIIEDLLHPHAVAA